MIDGERERELKALLVDLKMMCSRTSLALSRTTLLVEIMGWAEGLEKLTHRLAALGLDFEQVATTSVTVPDDVPGQVVMHDLDNFRVPDFVDDFE